MNPVKYRYHAQRWSSAKPVISESATRITPQRPERPRDRYLSNQARSDGEIGPGPICDQTKDAACPTGNPSAAVRRAASGCHYTRDHLPFAEAIPVPWESSLERKRALARRTTIVRPVSAGRVIYPGQHPHYNNSPAPINGPTANFAGFFATPAPHHTGPLAGKTRLKFLRS
jgi:hypothetical protein